MTQLAQRRNQRDETLEEDRRLPAQSIFQLPDVDLEHDGRDGRPEAGTVEDAGVTDREHAILLLAALCNPHRPARREYTGRAQARESIVEPPPGPRRRQVAQRVIRRASRWCRIAASPSDRWE